LGKITRGFILEEVDIDEVLVLYKMYRQDSDMLLQIAIWALNAHPDEIEKGLGITPQYRERLEAVVVKMFAPEKPDVRDLN